MNLRHLHLPTLTGILFLLLPHTAVSQDFPAPHQLQTPSHDRLRAATAKIDRNDRILGGYYSNLQETPVAFIGTDTGMCSGTLVGRHEVLTAAHCLTGSYAAVYVGANQYSIIDSYYNGSYSSRLPVTESAKYDIALLILDKEVTGIEPAAIAYDLPLGGQETVRTYGYGLTEVPEDNPFLRAKYADLRIRQISSTTIQTQYADTGAAVCPGDSGGPLVFFLGPYSLLIGVTSQGTSGTFLNSCYYKNGSASIFTSLQSDTSQHFLSFFPSVWRVSGRKLFVRTAAELLLEQTAGIATSNKSAMLTYLRKVRQALKLVKGEARGEHLQLVKIAFRKARINKRIRKKTGRVARRYFTVASKLSRILDLSVL